MEISQIYDKNDLYLFLIESNRGSNSLFKESFFKKVLPSFYGQIIAYHTNYYRFDFKFSQKIYNYVFDVKHIPHCAVCGKYVKFNSFKNGYNKYCSSKCSSVSDGRKMLISKSHNKRTPEEIEKSNKKRERTCMEKYNVINVNKCIDVRKKQAISILNKSDEARNVTKSKKKDTWAKKSKEEIYNINKKRADTNSKKTKEERMESYKKSLATRIKNFGSLDLSYKMGIENAKKTNNELYGVDNFFQTDYIRNKNKAKWDEYRKTEFCDVVEYIKETDTYICKCMDDECNLCSSKIYSISTHNYLNRKKYGYKKEDICVIKNPIGLFRGRSKLQDEIYDFIKSVYDDEVLYNVKDFLMEKCGNKIELDIFLPNINVAFEVNGDFWHMNPKKYSKDDINEIIGMKAQEIWERDSYKKNICEVIGVSLYTIWENDWRNNNEDTKKLIEKIIRKNENRGKI